MARYVAYLRVSTLRQGKSGLGLAAQRTSIMGFLSEEDTLIGEFLEAQSGSRDDRTELWKAVASAKKHSAKLLIAKLDRFSRKVSFISRIMDEGVSLAVAEMPNASDFQLHIFAALAQEERRLISARTKAALAEAKSKGVVLGKNGAVLAAQNRLAAKRFAEHLTPTIVPLLRSGMSLASIARELNRTGIRTATGKEFHPQTVKNLIARIALD